MRFLTIPLVSAMLACTAPSPPSSTAEENLSLGQTLQCVEMGVAITGTSLGTVYLVATEGGLALAPLSGGASVPLAEGIGTIVSAGVLVSGLASIIACSIDVKAVWQAMEQAGAHAEAERVARVESGNVAVARCDTPNGCCLEDDSASTTREQTGVLELIELRMPNPASRGDTGIVRGLLKNVPTLDTELKTYVRKNYFFRANLGIVDPSTLTADDILIGFEELDDYTYRYRPGAGAMKKLVDGFVKLVAERSPAEIKTLRIDRQRTTEGYKTEECRVKDYNLDRFRR